MFTRLEIAPQEGVVSGSPAGGIVEIDTEGIIIRLSGTTPADRIADVVLALSAGR